MDISDFSYEDFASTLSKARIISQKYKYTCCIPGCNEITLKHSHIVPQCVLKKFICNERHVSPRLMMLLKKWKKVLAHETDLRTLYDILCHCSNNWCISPDCDERLLSALISRYSEDRMTVVFNEK